MEYLESNDSLMEAVERANVMCLEPIICHWDGTLFHKELRVHEINNNKVDDLRFKLGFDHVELIDSSMEEKQSTRLIFTTGNLKTLTMTFYFKLSDTKINGKIRICSVLNQPLNSSYKLHLTGIKLKSTVGLYIAEDSYRVDHIIHEFTDASISLMYKNGSKFIPVYNKVQASHIKHSLVQYIISNYTTTAIATIDDKLRSAFDLTSVSISLDGSFAFRNLFRLHTKKMKTAFDKLADEILDATNQLLLEKVQKITLPNISVVLNFKRDEKKSFQACRSSLMGTNFLFRKKSTAISLEDDFVVLYVPVDFVLLNINYKQLSIKYGKEEYRSVDVQEHYKTEGSYITISIRKLVNNQVDLNLLEFKIVNFIFLDSDNQIHIDSAIRAWVNNIVEFSVVPMIEEIYEKYLRLAMGHDKFTTLAGCATT